MGNMASRYTTDWPTIRDQVSPEEWEARVDLAACYRLVDAYGMTDLIYNHITLAHPRHGRTADQPLWPALQGDHARPAW